MSSRAVRGGGIIATALLGIVGVLLGGFLGGLIVQVSYSKTSASRA